MPEAACMQGEVVSAAQLAAVCSGWDPCSCCCQGSGAVRQDRSQQRVWWTGVGKGVVSLRHVWPYMSRQVQVTCILGMCGLVKRTKPKQSVAHRCLWHSSFQQADVIMAG